MKVIKYDEFDDLEYRRGSKEFGKIIMKLMDFLRMYKIQDTLTFNIDDFINRSNITIDEIKKLIIAKENGMNFYSFPIILTDSTISFKDLNKREKTRPFESNNF